MVNLRTYGNPSKPFVLGVALGVTVLCIAWFGLLAGALYCGTSLMELSVSYWQCLGAVLVIRIAGDLWSGPPVPKVECGKDK